ncbi:Protein fam13a [Blyttiomyces sp. JEL0837]|nr:Protein fam13a [Blyttiomyces sp. JEL0837]
MKKLLRRIHNVGQSLGGVFGPSQPSSLFNSSIEQLLVRDRGYLDPAKQPHLVSSAKGDKAGDKGDKEDEEHAGHGHAGRHGHRHHRHHHSSHEALDDRSESNSNTTLSQGQVARAAKTVYSDHVPVALQQFVHFLGAPECIEIEGIFRIAGSTKLVKELREEIEKNNVIDFSKIEIPGDAPSVATLFKQWIRDITDGVIPKRYFQLFTEASSYPSKLKEAVNAVPAPNRAFLEYLLRFILKVASHSSTNLMTIQNLAIVFAPNVFRCPSAPHGTHKGNPEKYLVESMLITKAMVALLENADIIFEDGDQVRTEYEMETREDGHEEMSQITSEPSRPGQNTHASHSRKSTSDVSWADDSTGRSTPELTVSHSPTQAERDIINAAVSETVGSMLFTSETQDQSNARPRSRLEPDKENLKGKHAQVVKELKNLLPQSSEAASSNLKMTHVQHSLDDIIHKHAGEFMSSLRSLRHHHDEDETEDFSELSLSESQPIIKSTHPKPSRSKNEGSVQHLNQRQPTRDRPKPPGRRAPPAPNTASESTLHGSNQQLKLATSFSFENIPDSDVSLSVKGSSQRLHNSNLSLTDKNVNNPQKLSSSFRSDSLGPKATSHSILTDEVSALGRRKTVTFSSLDLHSSSPSSLDQVSQSKRASSPNLNIAAEEPPASSSPATLAVPSSTSSISRLTPPPPSRPAPPVPLDGNAVAGIAGFGSRSPSPTKGIEDEESIEEVDKRQRSSVLGTRKLSPVPGIGMLPSSSSLSQDLSLSASGDLSGSMGGSSSSFRDKDDDSSLRLSGSLRSLVSKSASSIKEDFEKFNPLSASFTRQLSHLDSQGKGLIPAMGGKSSLSSSTPSLLSSATTPEKGLSPVKAVPGLRERERERDRDRLPDSLDRDRDRGGDRVTRQLAQSSSSSSVDSMASSTSSLQQQPQHQLQRKPRYGRRGSGSPGSRFSASTSALSALTPSMGESGSGSDSGQGGSGSGSGRQRSHVHASDFDISRDRDNDERSLSVTQKRFSDIRPTSSGKQVDDSRRSLPPASRSRQIDRPERSSLKQHQQPSVEDKEMIREEFRELKSRIKRLKADGAHIPREDRERYKLLSTYIKDFEEASSRSVRIAEAPVTASHAALERLAKKRVRDGRPFDVMNMSTTQMSEEKAAIKKELGQLKALFSSGGGEKPAPDDKVIMRELYNRYCELKSKLESQPSVSEQSSSRPLREAEPTYEDHEAKVKRYKKLKYEKKLLQIQLHEYQDDFRRKHGRPIHLPEDRAPIKAEYKRYKHQKMHANEMESCGLEDTITTPAEQLVKELVPSNSIPAAATASVKQPVSTSTCETTNEVISADANAGPAAVDPFQCMFVRGNGKLCKKRKSSKSGLEDPYCKMHSTQPANSVSVKKDNTAKKASKGIGGRNGSIDNNSTAKGARTDSGTYNVDDSTSVKVIKPSTTVSKANRVVPVVRKVSEIPRASNNAMEVNNLIVKTPEDGQPCGQTQLQSPIFVERAQITTPGYITAGFAPAPPLLGDLFNGLTTTTGYTSDFLAGFSNVANNPSRYASGPMINHNVSHFPASEAGVFSDMYWTPQDILDQMDREAELERIIGFEGFGAKSMGVPFTAEKPLPPPPPSEKTDAVVEGKHHHHDEHLHALVRGCRIPLTIWLVGYSTLSILPKAINNPTALSDYHPGWSVVSLARGELAYEPLFLLSGLSAGLALHEATPEGKTLPGTWHIIKFWAKKIFAVVPVAASCFAAMALSAFSGTDGGVQRSTRMAAMFGVVMDCAFYVAAPWAYQHLRKSDRGAAPRMVVSTSVIAGALSIGSSLRFNTRNFHADGIPWAHNALSSPSLSSASQIPLRFPAFFAGLALAVERYREVDEKSGKSKGPSSKNQILGGIVSAVIWGLLLFSPPGFGGESFAPIFDALRYPAAAVASYFALRPLIAVPSSEIAKSPWRRTLHKIVTHPLTETIGLVTLSAEMLHREIALFVLFLAKKSHFLDKGTRVRDGKLIGIWIGTTVLSLLAGYMVFKIVQAPSMRFFKKQLEKKHKKIG